MRVDVRYLGLFRTTLKKGEDEIELKNGSLFTELLDRLVEKYGEPLKKILAIKENILDPSFIATVNNITLDQLQGMKTKLNEGDRITLMIIVSGG